jgi:hypothetical protein
VADYQVSLSYAGRKLVPAGQVSWKLVPQRSADGTRRTGVFQITLNGRLVAFKGSPDPSLGGDFFWQGSGYPPDPDPATTDPSTRVARLRDKMGALRALFSQDGQTFLIQPGDGSAPIRFNPRIGDIAIDEGSWFQDAKYSISMEADVIYFGTTALDASQMGQADNAPSHEWSTEQADDVGRIFKVTHTASAVGRRQYDGSGNVTAEGWQVARDLVLGGPLAGTGAATQLGFDSQFLTATGVLNQSSFQPYNYVRGQQVDGPGGRFTVTETWTCVDPTAAGPTGQTAGKAVEDLTVENRYDVETGLYTVTANGVVTGLEERDPVTRNFIRSRYDNAQLRFTAITPSVLLGVCQNTTGLTLNPQVVSSTIARNKITGVFQYSMVFNTRVGNTDASYLTESIEIEWENPADVFAEIGVVGRAAGPILQVIGSKTRAAVTVSASIQVPVAYNVWPTIPVFNPLPYALTAIGRVPAQIFVASDRPHFDLKRGHYSRSTTYVFQ